ncbi:MAG: hypothetical protein AAGA77_22680 [Bacteroidota bacterium]
MRYLSSILSIAMAAMITSCDKSPDSAEVIGNSLDLYVQNSNGENLLGSTYLIEDIKLYYLNNGKTEEVFDANMAAPRNVKFVDIEGNTALRIFANLNDEEYPTTYLEWNAEDTDTIRCHYYRSEDNSTIQIDSVWYNGLKVFPDQAFGPTEGFKIVK